MHPLLLRTHLWNAALLLGAAVIALAADRLSTPGDRRPSPARDNGDVASYVATRGVDATRPAFSGLIPYDPFSGVSATAQESVAPATASPTVPALPRGRRLTAILVADDRRVAVIDDATVRVGDVLRDGAKVSAIQPDVVWLVEKNGRRQMLTLTTRGR